MDTFHRCRRNFVKMNFVYSIYLYPLIPVTGSLPCDKITIQLYKDTYYWPQGKKKRERKCRTTQSSRGCLQTFLIYPELIVPGPLSRDMCLCVILCSCRHDTVFYYIKKCLVWLFFFLPYQAFHNSLKHSLAFLFITIPNFYDLKTSQEQTCNINSPYR